MTHLRALLILLLFAASASAQQLAFPTAEGFGRFSTGGRGGAVHKVTNTSNSGAGSLRACIIASGPRTCVFDVAGTITLQTVLEITNGNLTIAGQTAPGDGIMIRGVAAMGNHLQFNASNITARHIRIRPGYSATNFHSRKAWGVYTRAGVTGDDIIIDHVSAGWASDDIASVGGIGDTRDVTVQWCIFSEGINHSGDAPGKPFLFGVNADSTVNSRISFHHNLLHNFNKRNPRISSGQVDFVNNVIDYFVARENILPTHNVLLLNMVNNYHSRMENTAGTAINQKRIELDGGKDAFYEFTSNSSVYFSGNRDDAFRTDDSLPDTTSYIQDSTYPISVTGTRHSFPLVTTHSAIEGRSEVLAKAGAFPTDRDSIDQRAVDNATDGTGDYIGHESEVGGYPTYSGTARDGSYDTDGDGIPNAWETLCATELGLNPSVGTDGDDIIAGVDAAVNGYSKLEVFLNERAGDYPLDTCGGLLSQDDTTDPTSVAVTAPSASAVVSGTSVSYTATAQDETAMQKVEFYANGALIGTDTNTADNNYGVTWNTTTFPEGGVSLYVIAHDTSGNTTQSATVNVNVDNISIYTVVHAGSAPTINGTLTEFSGANSVPLVGTTNTTDLRFMWNSTNLYIGALTTDTQLKATGTTHDGSGMFNDDSLEFVIDSDNDGVWETTDYKFIVTAGNFTWDARNLSDLTYEPTYSKAVALVTDLNDGEDDTSWSVEIAIPWAQMGITPAEASIYGFNVQINDFDAARTTYRWNGAINTITDAMDVTLGPPTGDTEDPTSVMITNPTSGSYVSGNYLIEATAQDNVGVASVEFLEGANTLCTDTSAPFTCSWDTSGESEGSYSLTIEACDVATNCTTSSPATSVTVDRTSPSNPTNLGLTTIYEDDANDFSVTLDWNASTDASGILSYEIERCESVGCSTFSNVDSSSDDVYSDNILSENTAYCYRVRALDGAQNISASYTDTECIRTLDVVQSISVASILTDDADLTVSFPGLSTGLTDGAASSPTAPSSVTGLTDSASGTVVFPPLTTGVRQP